MRRSVKRSILATSSAVDDAPHGRSGCPQPHRQPRDPKTLAEDQDHSEPTQAGSPPAVDAFGGDVSSSPATRVHGWSAQRGVGTGASLFDEITPPDGMARDKARQDQQGQDKHEQPPTAPGFAPNGRPGFSPAGFR